MATAILERPSSHSHFHPLPSTFDSRMESPARPRLSLQHGTSCEAIVAYMNALGESLSRRNVQKLSDSWTPSTPQVKDCYRFVREIGRGHFGVVRMCEEKATNQIFACKTILKSSIKKEEDVSELCSEVISMVLLQQKLSSHESIVQLHEVLEDEEAVHLVLEYCTGGDLFDYVSLQKRISEREAAHIMKQLVSAVQCMHMCGIVHRDLKPENILLCKPKGATSFSKGKPDVKVADFGLCVALTRYQQAKGVAGSPFYMAPEVIRGKLYGREVDVWSLGVILYTCLAGSLPFWGRGHEAVFAAVLRAKPDFTKKPWPLVSPEAKSLIRMMLNPDAQRRISLSDVLSHPWMVHNCPELKQRQQQEQEASFNLRGWTIRHLANPIASTNGLHADSITAAPASGSMRQQGEEASTRGQAAGIPSGGHEPGGGRYGSPTWLVQLAAHRVEQAQQQSAKESKGEEVNRGEKSHCNDLHMIPSPPRACKNEQSPCSSPSLLHKVHAALSLAHPFPRLYSPFANSNGCTPVASPLVSPALSPATHVNQPVNIFKEERGKENQRCSPAPRVSPRLAAKSTLEPIEPVRDVSVLSLLPAAASSDVMLTPRWNGLNGANVQSGEAPQGSKDGFKKLSVFISSPTCLSPADSLRQCPSDCIEVDATMDLSEGTPVQAFASKNGLQDLSPFSVAENVVSRFFSPGNDS